MRVANAGRENLDPGHVSRYDSKEDAAASSEVELLRALGMDRESVVVDIGAGTGQFALAAAACCRRVVAVDASPVMLRALRSNVARSGLDNVEPVHAGFLSYEHHGRPADVVYSRYALHHLPDAWKAIALTRMRRMLAAEGILRLWDVVYGFPAAGGGVHRAVVRHRVPRVGPCGARGARPRRALDIHLAARTHDPPGRSRHSDGRVLRRRVLRQVRPRCRIGPTLLSLIHI